MPSLREERLQERVAEIRPTAGQGQRDRREGRGREPGHDRRGAEDLRRDRRQGPSTSPTRSRPIGTTRRCSRSRRNSPTTSSVA